MVSKSTKVAKKCLKTPRTRLVKYICNECGAEIKTIKGSVCYHCHKQHKSDMVSK